MFQPNIIVFVAHRMSAPIMSSTSNSPLEKESEEHVKHTSDLYSTLDMSGVTSDITPDRTLREHVQNVWEQTFFQF